MRRKSKFKKGFTVVEMITAATIFIVIMTISMGAIVSIFETNRRARTMRSGLSNINLVLETMAREVRFGKNYHCGPATTGNPYTAPKNCPSLPGGTILSFLSEDGVQITYQLTAGVLEKQEGASASFIAVTSTDVVVNNISFFVIGAESTDSLHPKVIFKIRARSGTGKSQSDFFLQTLSSQRVIET